MKTSWNLKLLYKSDTDPQLEKDLRTLERALGNFEKKYRGKDFTSTARKLKSALVAMEKLSKTTDNLRPQWYFGLRQDLETQNEFVQAQLAKIEDRLTKASNKVTFFHLELGKISPAKQKAYLKDKDIKDYKYLLEVIFKNARYNLTEKEEQMASLLSQPGYGMWVDGNHKLLGSKTLEFKGKTLPLPQAVGMLHKESKKDRQVLHKKINEVFKSVSHFSEAEVNAVFSYKKIMDERRGLAKPYTATVLGYENDEKAVENLVSLVTRSFSISHRFYKLHAKLLKEKKITLADRSVEIGEIKKQFDFSTTTSLVKKAFGRVDEKYAGILERFLEKGQIDVYPKKGKTGGAYCSGGGDRPTFVLLNHTNDINSVETLAHEMGHAFHTEFSKVQPPRYRDYTIAVAEVASTFFEQLVGEELEKELGDKEKAVLLHNRLKGDVSTIFRQIAFFNFELELHNKVRKEGYVSKDEIVRLMKKHLESYLGPAVGVTDEDGYFFTYLSHMRRPFYVYSYAYGQIISRALFEKWKEDKGFTTKIEKFLSLGGSMSPEDIFKSIGVNTSDPKFFEKGLKGIERDIEKLEKLTKKV